MTLVPTAAPTPELVAIGGDFGWRILVRPQRGQYPVTERMQRCLPMPLSGIRETEEGRVQVAQSKEQTGFTNA